MFWKVFESYFASDNQPATGTYADGLFPILAAKDLANERERNFRDSYARDYSSGREMKELPLGLS